MLNYFKSNNLSVVFVNALLIILYRVFYFFRPYDFSRIYHHSEPATKFLISLTGIGPDTNSLWLLIAGGLLGLLCSLLVNAIIRTHRVTTKANYMGGVLFTTFTSMIPECMVISPSLIAVFILLICIYKTFTLVKPEKLYGQIFDLGFLSALSILFYFPSVYFIIFVAFGFFIMRPASFRERMVVFTGFLSVFILIFTIYFCLDSLRQMPDDMLNFHYRIRITYSILSRWQIITVSWIAILCLIIMVFMPQILFSSVIQTRKYISILVIAGAYSLLALPLVFNFNLSHAVFVLATLSILYTLYFVESRTNIFREILFIVLLLSVFIFQYLPLLVVL